MYQDGARKRNPDEDYTSEWYTSINDVIAKENVYEADIIAFDRGLIKHFATIIEPTPDGTDFICWDHVGKVGKKISPQESQW